MKSEKNKGGRVTIANVLAIVGLVLLTIFFFIGELYLEEGALEKSILLALLFLVLTAGLLYLLIKVKGVENDFKKWRVVEYLLLAIYVGNAAYFSFGQRGFIQYFSMGNKEVLIREGKGDIDKIRQLFSDYEKFENEAIDKSCQSFMNAREANKSYALEKFMSDKKIYSDSVSILNFFYETQKELLLGRKYQKYRARVGEQLVDYDRIISMWSTIRMPFCLSDLNSCADSVAHKLTLYSNSERVSLPVLEREYDAYDIAYYNQAKEFEKPVLKLHLSDPTYSIKAWVLYIVLHLCVLLNYFLAYRSDIVEYGVSRRKRR